MRIRTPTMLMFMLILLSIFSYGALEDDVIVYYQFDNGTGESDILIKDIATGKNNGSVKNGLALKPGKFGSSFGFNGSSYINISTDHGLPVYNHTHNWSINFWLNISNPSGDDMLYSEGDFTSSSQFFNLFLDDAGSDLIKGTARSSAAHNRFQGFGNVQSDLEPDNDTFNMITIRYYRNGTVQVFINSEASGCCFTQTDDFQPTYSGGDHANIGAHVSGASEPFTIDKEAGSGSIDEFVVWNRTLSDAEIDTLFNSGSGTQLAFVTESIASFVAPTPADALRTNNNQTINVSCTETPSGVYLYFTNESTINESHLVLTNSTATTYTTTFTDDDIYNYTAHCEFEGTRGSNISRTLELDTTSPIATGITNLFPVEGDTLTFSINFTDEHFFGHNTTCPTNNVEVSEFGLDTTFYQANFSFQANNSDTCTVFYADGHTAKKLRKNWDVIKSNKQLEFRVGHRRANKLLLHSNQSANFKHKRARDRFNINVSFPNAQRGVNENYVFRYRTSPNSYYIESEEFPGWIVDLESLTWFDMKGADNVNVFQISPGVWEMRVRTDAPHLFLQSTGELNTITETFTITTSEAFNSILIYNQCPSTTADVLILSLVFLVITAIYLYLRNVIRIPIMTFMWGFTYFGFFMVLRGCHAHIAIAGYVATLIILVADAYIVSTGEFRK